MYLAYLSLIFFCFRDCSRNLPAAAQWGGPGVMAVKAAHALPLVLLMSCAPRAMAMREEKMSMSVSPSQTCVKMAAAETPLVPSHVAATKDMLLMRMA